MKRRRAPHTPWSEAPQAAKTTLFSFGGLMGLWSRCVGCLWMQLLRRFQWHHWRPCPTSTARDIANLSPSTFSYPWQLPTSMASLFLSPAINLSPVSFSPAIIVHQRHCHPKKIFSLVSLTPVINIHSRISPRKNSKCLQWNAWAITLCIFCSKN